MTNEVQKYISVKQYKLQRTHNINKQEVRLGKQNTYKRFKRIFIQCYDDDTVVPVINKNYNDLFKKKNICLDLIKKQYDKLTIIICN